MHQSQSPDTRKSPRTRDSSILVSPAYAVIQQTNNPSNSKVWVLINDGEIDILRTFLATGRPELNDKNTGKTVLTQVITNEAFDDDKKYEMVKLLVEHGAAVNLKDSNGLSPLMLAASVNGGISKLVRYLLHHGANPNEIDFTGRTALFYAFNIIANGKEPLTPGKDHLDRYDYLVLVDDVIVTEDNVSQYVYLNEKVIKLLVQYSNYNIVDKYGDTVLSMIMRGNNAAIVEKYFEVNLLVPLNYPNDTYGKIIRAPVKVLIKIIEHWQDLVDDMALAIPQLLSDDEGVQEHAGWIINPEMLDQMTLEDICRNSIEEFMKLKMILGENLIEKAVKQVINTWHEARYFDPQPILTSIESATFEFPLNVLYDTSRDIVLKAFRQSERINNDDRKRAEQTLENPEVEHKFVKYGINVDLNKVLPDVNNGGDDEARLLLRYLKPVYNIYQSLIEFSKRPFMLLRVVIEQLIVLQRIKLNLEGRNAMKRRQIEYDIEALITKRVELDKAIDEYFVRSEESNHGDEELEHDDAGEY